MIELRDLFKSFPGAVVLDGVSLTVPNGELFALCGPSGTGKTVTLKLIAGLLDPDRGDVLVDGISVPNATPQMLREVRSKLGYLFQSGALLAWKSVRENVELPLRENTHLRGRELDERVDGLLEAVGLLDAADRFPEEISGGMRKRAGLARAMALGPTTMLFDEPTSGLDPILSRQIDRLIRRLTDERGMTGIVVTHDLRGALEYADRIGLLVGGRLVLVAKAGEFAASRIPEVRRFLEAQFIS
ncbi:MAG: ATP-binding cassette domain-containing protein [Kiritimatiellia bacterium]|nr:ATP-binding cassette domain-containing protein [Kiritimatiellia bacterium]